MRKLAAAPLVCCLALSASAAASERAQHKRTVIAAALRRLEHRVARTQRRDPSGGFFILRVPKGISENEWTTAVQGDRRLWRLLDPELAPKAKPQQADG